MTILLAMLALIAPQQAQPPKPIDPVSWVSTAEYPPQAIQLGMQGTISFKLDVGADGKVTNCTVTASTGHPLLDRQTCDVMLRNARFQPALDAKGQPVPGVWASRYRWELPGSQ